jgi:hypothetical protein
MMSSRTSIALQYDYYKKNRIIPPLNYLLLQSPGSLKHDARTGAPGFELVVGERGKRDHPNFLLLSGSDT